jgi:TolB-like protein/DNA-binding winged helix-turn-helix (wHTH) protein/Tfp pilus assembly protein PilF
VEGDFQVGRWLIQPKLNSISGNGKTVHVEPKVMQVLVCLAEHAGDVVGKERLIHVVWPDTFVTDDVLTRAISELRKAFDDDPHEPRFIQTIPKGGYRLIAPVEAVAAVYDRRDASALAERRYSKRWLVALAAGGLIVFTIALVALNVAGLRDRLFPRPAPPAGKIMLVVLPFDNLSGDPEQEYFSDGMTEEMTAQLGQLSPEHLGVIGRASAMTYKGRKKTIDEIGKELRVQYVLEGSVRRQGDRVRVTAQLIEVGNQTHVWAQSYERDLRDILALQADVAQAIAYQVEIKLTPQVQTRLASARPVNPEAYQAFLKAQYYWSKWPEEEYKKSIEYIRRAIALDPTYALAHADLGYYYMVEGTYSLRPVEEAAPLARAAAMKALELDETLAPAHHVMGAVKFLFDWDWAGAEQEFKRALEVNPNSGDSHSGYGIFLINMGRSAESISELRKAVELDPLRRGRILNLAYALYWARRFDESIAQFKNTLEMAPDLAYANYGLGLNYAQKRMYPEALAACGRAVGVAPEDQVVLGACGMVYALAGRRQDALALLNRLKKIRAPRHLDSYYVALVYDGLGDNDRTMEWLERAYRERSPSVAGVRCEVWSDSLRADPRFQDLLRRMNFPP